MLYNPYHLVSAKARHNIDADDVADNVGDDVDDDDDGADDDEDLLTWQRQEVTCEFSSGSASAREKDAGTSFL